MEFTIPVLSASKALINKVLHDWAVQCTVSIRRFIRTITANVSFNLYRKNWLLFQRLSFVPAFSYEIFHNQGSKCCARSSAHYKPNPLPTTFNYGRSDDSTLTRIFSTLTELLISGNALLNGERKIGIHHLNLVI